MIEHRRHRWALCIIHCENGDGQMPKIEEYVSDRKKVKNFEILRYFRKIEIIYFLFFI